MRQRRRPRTSRDPARTTGTDMEWARFVAERDAAFRTLDADRIIAFASDWNLSVPANPTKFWVLVHLVRINSPGLTPEERQASQRWFEDRGLDWRLLSEWVWEDRERIVPRREERHA